MKKTIKWLIGIILCAFLCSIIGSIFLLRYALTPGDMKKDLDSTWRQMTADYPGLAEWRDSLLSLNALRDTFITDKGDKLHAYFVNQPNADQRPTALLVHGYTDNAIRMMMLGKMYERDFKYNILLPDLRHAGLSEGSYVQMGWNDRKDLHLWLDLINRERPEALPIVVHGVSMGAATTMMLSGDKDLPNNLRAFIEDCGYTSVWAQFKKELKERFHLPSFPILNEASLINQVWHGWSFKEASALNQVAQCHLPMLFIHGSKDAFVPTYMVYELYKAKPAPKAIWIAPNSEHALSYHDYPEAYTEKVADFLHNYVSNDSCNLTQEQPTQP